MEIEYIIELYDDERLFKCCITDWSKEDGDDTHIRYCMVGKVGKIVLEVVYVLFTQVKSKGTCQSMILNKGKCQIPVFNGIWDEIKESYKDHFNVEEVKSNVIDFVEMGDGDRAERIFNSIAVGDM